MRALEFVDAQGPLALCASAAPTIRALVVGLGAFGVVTRVTLAVEPTFDVRQDGVARPHLGDAPRRRGRAAVRRVLGVRLHRLGRADARAGLGEGEGRARPGSASGLDGRNPASRASVLVAAILPT